MRPLVTFPAEATGPARVVDARYYRARRCTRRASKLDPFKRTVRGLLETHPYSAVQILRRLREAGYDGAALVKILDMQPLEPAPELRSPRAERETYAKEINGHGSESPASRRCKEFRQQRTRAGERSERAASG